MSEITIVNNGSPVAGAAPGPSNRGAWLAQLESAQWQQRMRHEGGASQSRSDDEPAEAHSPPSLPDKRQTSPADPWQDGHRVRPADPQPAGRVHDVRQAAHALASAGPATQSSSLPGPAIPALQPVRVAQGAPQGQAWTSPRRALPADWQAQHAHVMAGAEGVRMWLRDARYQAGDGYRLLQQLRSQFARLGLRLTQFTLNGEQITAFHDPVDRTADSFQRGE